MYVPSRILYGGRSGAPIALILGTAAVTLLFAATPFLIAPVSSRYGVSEGAAGTLSVVQVGAFAATNFLLPRLVRPSGRVFRLAALCLLAVNIASVFASWFSLLLVLRVCAGAAAGAMTWLAWSQAMKRTHTMAPVAATGPITALVAAPILSAVATFGDQQVYAVLALATVPAVVMIAPVTGRRRTRGVASASRSNRVLLVVLASMTFFGSSLYINEAIVARDIHDLSAFAASIGFSLNALGGLVGARLSVRHRYPGWFIASIGIGVFVTVVGPAPFYFLGMFWWGFAFWMGVPGVLQMLVDRSLEPSERAGDGQGVMALGRAGGPLLGGVFVDAGSMVALAAVSATGIIASGVAVVGVKEGRDRLPATDGRTLDQRGDPG